MTSSELASVLIIDDSPGDILLLERMLVDAFGTRLKVNSCETLAEGLAAVATLEGPSEAVVLLDLFLPDSRGATTFRTFRNRASRIPVVVLTGLQDETVALDLVREGAQDFLSKGSVDSAILFRSIRYAWERKRNERELIERRAWWEALVQAIPDAVIIFDSADEIIFANPSAARLWGCAIGDLEGRHRLSLHPQSDPLLGVWGDGTPKGLAHGGPEGPVETLILTDEGLSVPVEVVSSQFGTEEGVFHTTVYRNLTERHKLEQQLVQTQKMEALGHLSAGIAHDFNNLLGIIMGHLDLLKRSLPEDPALQRHAQVSINSALRASGLTKRLLAFARSQPLKAILVDVRSVMMGFIEMAQRTVGPDISVRSIVEEGLPPILVDAGELENVLLNLTVNARDAMPEGGELIYRAEMHWGSPGRDDEASPSVPHVVISVRDSGTGMSSDVLDKVFEPFFTTKEKGKGTGLGLSMVYGFVKQSGGRISIESSEGCGTMVALEFPAASTPDVETSVGSERELSVPTGLRALVVDDEPELRQLVAGYLESYGISVSLASDGPSALAIIEGTDGLDLLVTDLLMPGGMDGGRLAQRIRERFPALKVIFVSGFPQHALGDKRLNLDSMMLEKPYRENELRDALRRVFDSRLPG